MSVSSDLRAVRMPRSPFFTLEIVEDCTAQQPQKQHPPLLWRHLKVMVNQYQPHQPSSGLWAMCGGIYPICRLVSFLGEHVSSKEEKPFFIQDRHKSYFLMNHFMQGNQSIKQNLEFKIRLPKLFGSLELEI